MSTTSKTPAGIPVSKKPATDNHLTAAVSNGIELPQTLPGLPDGVETAAYLPEEWNHLEMEKLEKLKPLKTHPLNEGAYLTRFVPLGTNYHYNGTIRLQHAGTNSIASGDLYYHKPVKVWPLPVSHDTARPTSGLIALGQPNPANGIPIFSRARYRYYLKITQLLEWISFSKTFTLGFEMWRFNGAGASPMWTNEGLVQADMTFVPTPTGYPSGADYLTGQVKKGGSVIGHLTMGWVAKLLRKATIEIDGVADTELPLESGIGHTWQSVFNEAGWELNVIQNQNNLAAVSGASWSDAEMHKAMLSWRDSANLDKEWRYHILAVNGIHSAPRGIMYDANGSDSNNIPRESICMASHWVVPNTHPWGKVKGMRFGLAKAPYFRTALHEIGHAMGLHHNTVDFGIMNTTSVIVAGAVAPVQFPDNIRWSFAPDDQKRLRHMPDIIVRPGGVPFGTSYPMHSLSADDKQEVAEGLTLHVTALHEVLPLGAPVRIELSLENNSAFSLPVPESLNMKYGCVKGRVIDAFGNIKTFSPIILCVDEVSLTYLQPGEKVEEALTLLRGMQGALFANPGNYTVEVQISWDLEGNHVGITGSVNVYVSAAKDDEHALAAMKVLCTPDALLSVVFAGDHLTDGIEAIQAALQHPVLRPHYAYIEARRLAQPFGNRKADIAAAAALLDEDTVMNASEIRKANKLIKNAQNVGYEISGKKLSCVLKNKATALPAATEWVDEVCL